MTDLDDTVSVPVTLVKDLVEHHKDAARFFYGQNQTEHGDRNHSWARQLNEHTDRDWNEVMK